MGRISYLTIIYGALAIISFLFFWLYRSVNLKIGKKDYYGEFVFLFATITILAYTILSCSKTLGLALFGNRLAYAGTILMMVDLFIVINQFCGMKNYKPTLIVLSIVSFFVCVLALSGGSSIKLYYKEVELLINNNYSSLIKTYGPLHMVYTAYVVAVFLLMIATVAFAIVKKKQVQTVSPMVLVIIVCQNIFVWIVDRFVDMNLNLVAVSYVISEMLLFMAYKNANDFEKVQTSVQKQKNEEDIVSEWISEYGLTERESQILQQLIDNIPRVEIAEKLFISEHTVKKHTAHIYEKLGVSSRNDLLFKLNNELKS